MTLQCMTFWLQNDIRSSISKIRNYNLSLVHLFSISDDLCFIKRTFAMSVSKTHLVIPFMHAGVNKYIWLWPFVHACFDKVKLIDVNL